MVISEKYSWPLQSCPPKARWLKRQWDPVIGSRPNHRLEYSAYIELPIVPAVKTDRCSL